MGASRLRVIGVLPERAGRDTPVVLLPYAVLRHVAQGILLFTLPMGACTAIALLVGGIVGQFLAESVAISGTGSLAGLAVGLGSAVAFTALMRARTEALIYAAVTPQTIVASIAAALVTGVLFGLYPAFRAARLTPVDAIRAE